MGKSLEIETFEPVRVYSNDACASDRLHEQMVLAVCDLEGFAADASAAGNGRAADILLAAANVLRSVIPFEFSTSRN